MKLNIQMLRRYSLLACLTLALLVSSTVPRAGGDPSACDEPGDSPDVLIADIYSHIRYGTVDGITAFAMGTMGCNIGSCWLNWMPSPSNQHPVIAQDMYRYMDGKFEQIGQAWLKHGFFALSGDFCFNDCIGTDGTHLGVHCSDPYSASLNGQQTGLGPKYEVNPATGFHPHPVTDINLTGNDIYKRLQVHNVDLDPDLNEGASYYIGSLYIAEDEIADGDPYNSYSYREVDVFGSGTFFDFDLVGQTIEGKAPIVAWTAHDPQVSLKSVDVFHDGRFMVGSKATEQAGGIWHYEYAILNINSHRAGQSFTVPLPLNATPTNIGFHDVDYHSGEPYDGTDWAVTIDADSITWATQPYSENPNANALRWDTLYNFRFDLNAPPIYGEAVIGLFRTGPPTNEAPVTARVPLQCNSDGTCDPGEACICLDDCPGDGPDDDVDQVGLCLDCDDGDGDIWDTPGEVQDLMVRHDAATGMTTLTWNPPAFLGGTLVSYETLRSLDPASFAGLGSMCLTAPDPTGTSVTDGPAIPPAGTLYYYVVRAENDCPQGSGSIGTDSEGEERNGRGCP